MLSGFFDALTQAHLEANAVGMKHAQVTKIIFMLNRLSRMPHRP